jgi:hypothetical protein
MAVRVRCNASAHYVHDISKGKSDCHYDPATAKTLPTVPLTEPLRTSVRITDKALVYLHNLTKAARLGR